MSAKSPSRRAPGSCPLGPGQLGPGRARSCQLASGQQDAPRRLKQRAEFLRVAASGQKAAIGGVVLQALLRGDDGPVRLGFTVTRKVGNAVVRNRTRRRLKEAARLLLTEHPVHGADLVLIGRDSTRKRNFRALQADIRRALDRNGVS